MKPCIRQCNRRCESPGRRHHLAWQLQALCRQFSIEKIDARQLPPGRARLSTRPSLAGSSAETNDGNSRGCCLGHGGSSETSACGDHGDPTANQLRHQRGQPVNLIVGPAIIDGDILARDDLYVGRRLAWFDIGRRRPRRGITAQRVQKPTVDRAGVGLAPALPVAQGRLLRFRSRDTVDRTGIEAEALQLSLDFPHFRAPELAAGSALSPC